MTSSSPAQVLPEEAQSVAPYVGSLLLKAVGNLLSRLPFSTSGPLLPRPVSQSRLLSLASLSHVLSQSPTSSILTCVFRIASGFRRPPPVHRSPAASRHRLPTPLTSTSPVHTGGRVQSGHLRAGVASSRMAVAPGPGARRHLRRRRPPAADRPAPPAVTVQYFQHGQVVSMAYVIHCP